MLNPTLLAQLESFGLTNEHLEQLLATCQRGCCRIAWHVDSQGTIAQVEVALFAARRDSRAMRHLTQILQKERA